MKLLKIINPENVNELEVEDYKIRVAVRAIVIDEKGKIALLNVSKHGYYKIPGGGIENSEDNKIALQRECLEEIGCDIEVLGEIGKIVEYRKFSKLKQISYCYFAKTTGKKKNPKFTQEEIASDFKVEFVSYKKSLDYFYESSSDDFEGRLYIVPRDLTFLEHAFAKA